MLKTNIAALFAINAVVAPLLAAGTLTVATPAFAQDPHPLLRDRHRLRPNRPLHGVPAADRFGLRRYPRLTA